MAPASKTISIEHVVIPSKRSFEDTRAALESTLPELDMGFKALADAGDHQGAIKAMEALPPLNIFSVRPRNVNALLPLLNHTGKALQFEIGNPLTPTKMTQHNISAGLYVPLRVVLLEKKGEAPTFEYDSPASSLAQFEDERIQEVARHLDEHLKGALVSSAGWEKFGEWE